MRRTDALRQRETGAETTGETFRPHHVCGCRVSQKPGQPETGSGRKERGQSADDEVVVVDDDAESLEPDEESLALLDDVEAEPDLPLSVL